VNAPLVPSAEPGRPMPDAQGARLDAAAAAVAALDHERRRLERLGLETPLARCHEQLRYWRFVAGVLALPRDVEPRLRPGEPTWPAAPRR
jgi:hypothetical protein